MTTELLVIKNISSTDDQYAFSGAVMSIGLEISDKVVFLKDQNYFLTFLLRSVHTIQFFHPIILQPTF